MRALTYATFLDRCTERRTDEAWVAEQRCLPSTRFVPVSAGLHLIEMRERAGPAAGTLSGAEVSGILGEALEAVFLGRREDAAVFAIGVEEGGRSAVEELSSARFTDLRKVGPLLEPGEAGLLAYTRAMLYWHDTHRFCGRCGAPTRSRNAGHMRICSNEACARPSFPRTDPAVIMLVERPAAGGEPAKCLLGRSAGFVPGAYSTLAGFVEPGESLEQAVAREVREETGVEVADVRYLASQPWPFPANIMLGFFAKATTTELWVDPVELDDARWFTAAELEAFGEWGDEKAEFRHSRTDSISRFLVDTWYRRNR